MNLRVGFSANTSCNIAFMVITSLLKPPCDLLLVTSPHISPAVYNWNKVDRRGPHRSQRRRNDEAVAIQFSEEQITYALRQAEAGTPVADVCRQLVVSEATFYIWKKKYAARG